MVERKPGRIDQGGRASSLPCPAVEVRAAVNAGLLAGLHAESDASLLCELTADEKGGVQFKVSLPRLVPERWLTEGLSG